LCVMFQEAKDLHHVFTLGQTSELASRLLQSLPLK
jgi:hypothetical protein